MPGPSNELERQIEAAYDFRGHVTLALASGESLEGFLYNREFANPLSPEENYVDVLLKNSDERRRIAISAIRAVALSGEDCAAGKSYEDYMRKKAAQP